MSEIWVSKSGNNSNVGTPASPKLTITAAMSGSAASGIIYITTGNYNEQINWGVVTPVDFTMIASGRVIVDAQGLRTSCYTHPANTNNLEFRGMIFQNATQQLFISSASNGSTRFIFRSCEFRDAPAVAIGTGTNQPSLEIYNCATFNMNATTDAAFASSAVPGFPLLAFDSLFDNITAASGVMRMAGTNQPIMYRNIFNRVSNTNNFYFVLTGAVNPNQMDYNWYDVGARFYRNGTSFADLAAWKAIGATTDPHSVSGSADFVDRDRGLFSTLPGGNLLSVQPNGGIIGPFRVAYGLSQGRNASQFLSGAMQNVSINASGNIQIVDTNLISGIVTFNTQDLGAVVRLRALRLSTLGEVYPTDVVDAETDDVPNHHTVEYRTSSTSQVDCESQSYSKVRRVADGLVNFPQPLNARWIQIRLTLRTNGVAA
jgi:hypothetical protein